MYPKVQMFIAGEWTDGTSGKSEDILNPATGQLIGKTPHARARTSTARWRPPRPASRSGARSRRSTATS